MSKLDPINENADKVVITQIKVDQQEYTLIGGQHLYKGCKLYSLNIRTKIFTEVELKAKVDAIAIQRKNILSFSDLVLQNNVGLDRLFRKYIDADPDCIYAIASNGRNAAKKINKQLPGTFQIKFQKDSGTKSKR